MIIGVTGSRSFSDYSALSKTLDNLNPTQIISGGAKGADTLAEKYAEKNNIPFIKHLPKFKIDPNTPYHPRWYLKRNEQIVRDSETIVACWDNKSKGTKHTVDYAKKMNRPVCFVGNQPQQQELF
jgi:predicted Rossmann fold nucleotide-binding protein DprA/Smf involved in DNA uptake